MNVDFKNVKKILVMKLRHLGDVLLSTPFFEVLKDKMPNAQIDAYIYREAFEVLDKNPNISDILLYDREIKKMGFLKKIKEEIKILKDIRKRKYDMVFNLTEGDRGAIVAFFSKAKYKIGFDDRGGLFQKRKIYTHLVKNTNFRRHTVDKNLDMARILGIFPKNKSLYFHIAKEDFEKVDQILKKENFEKEKFIMIHPAARWIFKCYPVFRVKNLIKKLLEKGEKIILTSSKDEFEIKRSKEILDGINSKNILNLSGNTSIKEMGALIKRSKLLICMDSFPLHVASFLKAKTIALFGPTDDEKWGGWQNENCTIIKENRGCRPCLMNGCGASGISECLYFSEDKILEKIYS